MKRLRLTVVLAFALALGLAPIAGFSPVGLAAAASVSAPVLDLPADTYARLSAADRAAYASVRSRLLRANIWTAARNAVGVAEAISSKRKTADQIVGLYLAFCARYGNDPDAGLRQAHGDGAMLAAQLLRYGVELVPHGPSVTPTPTTKPAVVSSRTTDSSTVLARALLPFPLDWTGNATAEDTREGAVEMYARKAFLEKAFLDPNLASVNRATLTVLVLTGHYHPNYSLGTGIGVDPSAYAGLSFEAFVAKYTKPSGAPGDGTVK
ncbi:MAG: hypothetical protein ABIT01_19560 [Thermoanaerobaculia bacterium]